MCVYIYHSHCHCHIMSHTSIGKLISLSVDNPKQHQHQHQQSPSPPPPLVPINNNNAAVADGEEQTMLWQNVATLFAKCEQNESDIQDQNVYVYGKLTRGMDDLYQELQDAKIDIAQIQCERDHNKHGEKATEAHYVKKMKKYVDKKCEKVRETVSYGSYNADNEIFAYIDKVRAEFEAKTQKMEDEITRLNEQLDETTITYDSDYAMFVQRENDLMEKLDDAVQRTECLNQRIKDHEGIIIRQIQQLRDYADQRQYQTAGDLREEFTRAICREVEYESKETAKLMALTNEDTDQRINLVMNHIQHTEDTLRAEFETATSIELSEQMAQGVSDKMTDLITRSNEYHSARYFGLVDDVKTMRQSIGMVDAELSDVKETVEFLKDEVAETSNEVYEIKEEMTEWNDEVYNEMDRDYYDLKDYVKRRMHRHEKQKHAAVAAVANANANAVTDDPLQMIVTEYAAEPDVPVPAPEPENDEHIIIIDADTLMLMSDDDEEIQHT